MAVLESQSLTDGISCTMEPQRRMLRTDAQAPGDARRFLAEVLCTEHTARVLDEAQLLVSELVGNSVRHGLPPVEVDVRCTGGNTLEVRVRDGLLAQPKLKHVDEDSEGGRGIALVDLLSQDWGIDVEAQGKVVWFRLAL
ncbi:MAG: ATP-binding protein [Sporichthyaceae bacterium]|jgi:anti-sigma regulatory factor (Ser/Thr protein kinase)